MKIKNIFKILMIAFLLLLVTGCRKEPKTYVLTQDGNFSVYLSDGVTEVEGDTFASGTRLLVLVNAKKIPQDKMIDKVFINEEANLPIHQYNITMNHNVKLRVTFKDIPSGLAKVLISADELSSELRSKIKLKPERADGVYEIGTEVTVEAPEYYKFVNLKNNDEVVLVNDTIYTFKVEGETTIVASKDSLEKTHGTIEISSPSDKVVVIRNESSNKYYKIGSNVILTAPENFSFAGSIVINDEEIPISGATITITLTDNIVLTFNNDNFVPNKYQVSIDSPDVEIVEEYRQNLYAHDSKIYIKATHNNGRSIIDKMNVNGEEVIVNSAIYQLEIKSDTIIDNIVFADYEGKYQIESLNTSEIYPVKKTENIYTSDTINMVLASNNGDDCLVFQTDGVFQARIDDGIEIRYIEFIVKYEVSQVQIYQTSHVFISRQEVIDVGASNQLSLELEIITISRNPVNVNELISKSFIAKSNQIGNLDYRLEDRGKDVSTKYLDYSYDIKLKPEAIGKSLDLIITLDDGISITKPIFVVDGYNVNSAEEIGTNEKIVIQSDLAFDQPWVINNTLEVIGNYHLITFNSDSDALIKATSNDLSLKNVMLKSNNKNQVMIETKQTNLNLDNIVIEDVKIGVHAINSKSAINQSKFHNIESHNLVLVNNKEAIAAIPLETNLTKNVFNRTNSASVLIVDLYNASLNNNVDPNDEEVNLEELIEETTGEETPQESNNYQVIKFMDNDFKNIKNDLISDEELTFLETIPNSEFVISHAPLEYNYAFKLDGGQVYKIFFPDVIGENENPKCEFIK